MTLPESIPLRRDSSAVPGFAESTDFSSLAGLALLVVFVLLAFALWRKRYQKSQGNNELTGDVRPPWARWFTQQGTQRIRAVSSTRLTTHHSLHEVEWQGKRLLIGCAEHSISLITETAIVLPDADTSRDDRGVAP